MKIFEKIRQWYKSKMIWFGTVVVPVLLQILLWAQQNVPMIKENLGTSYGIVGFVIGGIIFGLRLITSMPVDEKTKLLE